MSAADLHTLIRMLDQSLGALGLEVAPLRVEGWALLIHRAMSGQSRSFHRGQHLVELSQGADPLATLAALFHDIVYLQVDQGVPRHLEPLLAPYLELAHGEPVVRPATPGAAAVALCLHLFGVRPGEAVVKVTGVNELMSALVAAGTLGEVVPLPQLASILASIEATIPFRQPAPDRPGPFEQLEERLRTARAAVGLALDDTGIAEVMARAVWVANQDVANFAERHPHRFLENTWKLLPEGNPSLRNHELYTAGEYRLALQKMHGFLASLRAEWVFHRHRGVPREAEYHALTERARHNLEIAVAYLRVKLLAIAAIEALARATGGDAPLELLMGGLHPERPEQRLEVHLPHTEHPAADCLPEVIALLEGGRSGDSGFDLQQAPVAAFLYRRLGEAACSASLDSAQALFAGRLEPVPYLQSQDRAAMLALAQAAAEVATTRREALLRLGAKLKDVRP